MMLSPSLPMKFQSTLPAWGATTSVQCVAHSIVFQSTLPAWGATRVGRYHRPVLAISIHASRMGSDACAMLLCATFENFNPRSPRGERPYRSWYFKRRIQISIHAPRVGSDVYVASFGPRPTFQSTLPAWGATLRALAARSRSWHFNPRSPRGERPFRSSPTRGSAYFNPRSPRGERRFRRIILQELLISIHAPRVGSDRASTPRRRSSSTFQSTLPAWGATFLGRFINQRL